MNKNQIVQKLRKETEAPLGIVNQAVIKAMESSHGDNEYEVTSRARLIIESKMKERGEEKSNVSLNISDEERYKGSIIVIDDNTTNIIGNLVAMKALVFTDFAAKNKDLIKFLENVVSISASREIFDIDKLLKEPYNETVTVNEKLNELIGIIGENIKITSLERVSSYIPMEIASFKYYNHRNRFAAMVCYIAKNQIKDGKKEEEIPAVTAIMNMILNHIIFNKPLVVKEGDLPEEIVKAEKDKAIKQVEGKDDNIKDNVMKGIYNKFLDEVCMDRQVLLGDEDKPKKDRKTIRQYLDEYKIDIIDFNFVV